MRKFRLFNGMGLGKVVTLAGLAFMVGAGRAEAVTVQVGPECVTAPATPFVEVCIFTGAKGLVCVPILSAMPGSKYCATLRCDVDGSVSVSEGAADIPRSCEVAQTVAFSGTATCTVKVTKNGANLYSQMVGPIVAGPGVSPIEACVNIEY